MATMEPCNDDLLLERGGDGGGREDRILLRNVSWAPHERLLASLASAGDDRPALWLRDRPAAARGPRGRRGRS